MFKRYSKLWLGLGVLIILTPLGLLASGTAFGEWGIDQLMDEVGFIPSGLQKMADIWSHAPLADYAIAVFDGSLLHSALGYILSAVVGTALAAGLMLLFGKVVKD